MMNDERNIVIKDELGKHRKHPDIRRVSVKRSALLAFGIIMLTMSVRRFPKTLE
jgi:hypothetical protein